MDEGFLARHEAAVLGAHEDAIKEVWAMKLPLEISLPRHLTGLAHRANDQYTRTYDTLLEKYAESLPRLFAYAQWVKWFSCWDGAHWFRRSIENGDVGDTEYCRQRCTPSGYAETEGWAYAAFNKMGELSFSATFSIVLEHFGLDRVPADQDVLHALELHWLRQASEGCASHAELLEVLHEAGEAGALANGLHMWSESEKLALESITDTSDTPAAAAARTLLARMAAQARHAPGQAAREKVRARFTAERESFGSKDATAIAYTKDYPFEFSTIRDWLKGV